MDSLVGQIVDTYRIDEIIGRGGMGVVFKATDLNLEKTVALKMIDPFLARDQNFLNRFKTEAKALARLENQNIVSVYALRETSAGLFMVMEYVQAKTVSEWLREKGRLTLAETIAVTTQLLNAIGHAHSVGVIHRDIKPNNILLCDNGTVKVMDFGLAKVVLDLSSQNTATQTAAGTLFYMSPEQIKGLKNVDNRSDIYSIGMSIYEMLTGRTPFDKTKSEYDIQKQIIDGDIPSPDKYNPAIPKALVKFVRKAIDKDPKKRFQNVDEMKAALSEIDISDSSAQEKTIFVERGAPNLTAITEKPKNNKILLIAAASVTVIAVIFLAYYFISSGSPDETTLSKERVSENLPVKEKTNIVTPVSGNLLVKSEPSGADVYINGIKAGVTPFSKPGMQTQNYSISIRKSGYAQWADNNYGIKEGSNNINVTLNPEKTTAGTASLILNSIPASAIYINDKIVSSTGDFHAKLEGGNYSVKFVHPQYGSKSVSVDLSGSQSKSYTCYFEQQVNIQSLNMAGDPFWGTVYLNGVNTNRTTPVDLNLGPGKYVITVKKAGFKTVETDLTINVVPGFQKKNNPVVFHLQ